MCSSVTSSRSNSLTGNGGAYRRFWQSSPSSSTSGFNSMIVSESCSTMTTTFDQDSTVTSVGSKPYKSYQAFLCILFLSRRSKTIQFLSLKDHPKGCTTNKTQDEKTRVKPKSRSHWGIERWECKQTTSIYIFSMPSLIVQRLIILEEDKWKIRCNFHLYQINHYCINTKSHLRLTDFDSHSYKYWS